MTRFVLSLRKTPWRVRRTSGASVGLWDTDMTQYKTHFAHILPLRKWCPRVFFHPGSRLCHHLALVRDSIYASAITAYLSAEGIRGLKVHFPSGESSVFGRQKTYYPLHFALAEGEYLTSAWLNARHDHYTSVQRSDFVLAV